MQIPVNVPRIRDEHCSLPPSPWCHRYDDGKNCRAKSNVWSTWNSELHAESKPDKAMTLMEFQGPFWNDGSLYTFLHIASNCFYCCFYGNGRTLWSHYRFSCSPRVGVCVGGWTGRKTDVMALIINYKCCMCINIQTFSKPQRSREVIQIWQKKRIRFMIGGLYKHSQKYMEYIVWDAHMNMLTQWDYQGLSIWPMITRKLYREWFYFH